MATIVLRASKGLPLTSAEVDANFTNINNEVASNLSAVNAALSLKAPLASPALTGTPTAPTASVNTNTTQVATTAFVIGQSATGTPLMDGVGAVGVATSFAREDHIHPSDTTKAPLASPALTGTPTAPTAAVNTNTTQLATTAFVIGQSATASPLMDSVATVGTATKFAREDHIHPSDTTKANLASPALTGTPTAPTAAVDTNTTQVATTAFVIGQAATVGPLMDGSVAVGTSTKFAREDHRHPTDTTITNHISNATGAHAASAISNTPTGNIAATTVQAAINELDTEKVPRTSTTGSAVIPAGTTAQRDASPIDGLIRYNTDLKQYESYLNGNWAPLGSGQTLGNAVTKAIFYNSTTIAENLTVAAGTNGGTFGPVTINDGFTVTVSDGSVWTVV